MSIVSSKLFALNLVEVSPNSVQAGAPNGVQGQLQQLGDREARIASLESQLASLKEWKLQMSPVIKTVPTSSRASSVSSMESILDEEAREGSAPSSVASSTILKPKTIPTPAPTPAMTPAAIKEKKNKPQDQVSKIMDIIKGYGQNESNGSEETWLGSVKFEPIVRKHVDANNTIPFVLPAFPWKSVNKVEKVIGATADFGEELGLGRLNEMCLEIQEIYAPGAYVLLASDGLCYNDLLGIPDEETYEYGSSFKRMAEDLGYGKTMKFTRIMNMLGLTRSEDCALDEYLEVVEQTRDVMVSRYLPPGFSTRDVIQSDVDYNLTYCGYLLFLAKDLKHSPITAGVTGRNEYKRIVKRVATDMITRGKAFARLIEDIHPDCVRLSIHPSSGLTKLSFPLVPQPDHFSMTPWHCSIGVSASGRFITDHASNLRQNHDLVYKNGQPYCFRDRSEIWNWEGVDFEFFFPRGVKVIAKPVTEGQKQPKLGPADYKRLMTLGKGFSSVITSGFSS